MKFDYVIHYIQNMDVDTDGKLDTGEIVQYKRPHVQLELVSADGTQGTIRLTVPASDYKDMGQPDDHVTVSIVAVKAVAQEGAES